VTTGLFDRERRTYEREKQNLLHWEGEYVVICGDEILGHWPSQSEAYRVGCRTYGSFSAVTSSWGVNFSMTVAPGRFR